MSDPRRPPVAEQTRNQLGRNVKEEPSLSINMTENQSRPGVQNGAVFGSHPEVWVDVPYDQNYHYQTPSNLPSELPPKETSIQVDTDVDMTSAQSDTDVDMTSAPSGRENLPKPFTIPTKSTGSDIPSAYGDSRRAIKASSSQRVPASLRGGGSSNEPSGSSTWGTSGAGAFTERLVLPTWLASVPYNHNQQIAIDRNLESHLLQVKTQVVKVLAERSTPSPDSQKLDEYVHTIRHLLHSYEYQEPNAVLVKRSRLLELSGLPQLFLPRRDGFQFPFDIKADAQALFLKWARQDFDPDIMRGLDYTKKDTKKGTQKGTRWSTALKKDYPNRVSWKFFGAGDLVSGQWWPILLACMRDGAHGSPEAGISRVGNEGAASVLISGAHYDDKDEGDTIQYCGTEGKDVKITEDTKAMHDSIRTGKPVRVIRSAKLPRENHLRPDLGFRYDGTYKVLSYVVLDAEKPHHRFLLEREEDQDPIRWEGFGARPTIQDKEAYQNHKELAGS